MAVLTAVWPGPPSEELLAAYHRIEPQAQEGSAIPYREVMRQALLRIAAEKQLPLAAHQEGALGDSLPSWPPFPEVPAALSELRDRGWRLAILSNTDPDLLSASMRNIGVPVDLTITAKEAGSYKPAHGHWVRFRETSRAAPDRHVHIGARLFHDIAPAAELGIPAIWIDRASGAPNRSSRRDLPRAADLPSLRDLPNTRDRLVPSAHE